MKDLLALREAVAVMRELGVLSWDGIVLGPAPGGPATPMTPQDELAHAQREADRRHRTMYAATSFIPPRFGKPLGPEYPRAVVQRREAQEHDHGDPQAKR
jgi:hypothetical protein